MKPNHTDRHVQTTGVAATGEFQISLAHSAHIMRILRSQLYSDKILAVLREYSANAWDANREVGKKDVPIKVTLPTVLDPTLYIRDFGPGISHEDMFQIYAMYGVSTKRKSDGVVGMLGIGSKSGFAYTDSFTITTWQEGKQRIYTALLDNDDKGSLNLLDTSDSEEPTGTLVQVPVRPVDIPSFVQKAEKLFFHFKPRPEINTALPPEPVPEVVMRHGTITRGRGEWFAVMGCIAYQIDLSQLRGLNSHRGGAGEFLDRLDGYLYFDIGDVEIAASRESLEYSDKTKEKLIDKFIDLVDEFVKHTLDKIETGDFSFWEKRCRAQVLNDLHLPVPKLMSMLTDEKVRFDPKKFIITYGQKQVTVNYVHIDPVTRIIVRDEIRKIDGYGLSGLDYVIRPNKDLNPVPTIDEVRAELTELIEKLQITGVPVVNISTLAWHAKAKFNLTPMRASNKKHQVKTFVLKDDKTHYGIPWSDCWDIGVRTPTDTDVFVLLRKFHTIDDPKDEKTSTDFYATYMKDKEMAKTLKAKMPKIYGYKSTEKAPAKLDQIPGKKYNDWRIDFLKEMASSTKVKRVLDSLHWVGLVTREARRHWYREDSSVDPKVLAKLFTTLGKDHPICLLFRQVMIAKKNLKKVPKESIEAVRKLQDEISELDDSDSEPVIAKKALEETYPMFGLFEEGIKALLDEKQLDTWIDYIKLVDRAKKGLNDAGTVAHSNGRSDHSGVEGQSSGGEEGSTQLLQSEERPPEGEGGRGLGEDCGPLNGHGDGEGMVERQVRSDLDLRDLLRAASA